MSYRKNLFADGKTAHCKTCTCGEHSLDSIRNKSRFKADEGYTLQELFGENKDMLPMQAALAYGVARKLGLDEAANDIAHGFMQHYGRQLAGYSQKPEEYGQLEEAVSTQPSHKVQPSNRVARIARPSIPTPETQNFQYN